MNCDDFRALLDALMDDALTDEQRRSMEAHRRECSECAAAMRQTMQLKALFSDMDAEVDVPLPAQAQWREAVRREARGKARRRILRWASAAAAAVVVMVGVGVTINLRLSERSQSSYYFEASPDAEAPADAAEAVAYESAAEALPEEDYDLASNAVIEADGGATLEEEAAVGDVEEAEEAFEAAVQMTPSPTAKMRAPACELCLAVEDVEGACELIRDLAAEYEAVADVQAVEGGAANIYVEIDARNAVEFLNAVIPIDIHEERPTAPELAGEGPLLLMLTVTNAP